MQKSQMREDRKNPQKQPYNKILWLFTNNHLIILKRNREFKKYLLNKNFSLFFAVFSQEE